MCEAEEKEASKESSAPYLNIVQHLAVVAALASLFLGCASNARESASATPGFGRRSWHRQQEGARENGRIGWVGYDGPGSQ
jgi:hypothetical protein